MPLWRMLLTATAIEVSFFAALLAWLGLIGGPFNGWLDVINNFAPVIFVVGCAAGASYRGLAGPLKKRLVLLLAALACFATGLRMLPEALSSLPRPKAEGAPLRVLSFNVWEDNFDTRKTADIILRTDADVVTLIENERLLKFEGDRIKARYPYYAQCTPQWVCGITIFSKQPIVSMGTLMPPLPLTGKGISIVWATISAPNSVPVTVMTTHLAWPFPPKQQALQRSLVAKTAARVKPDILTGDMNLTPWSYALGDFDRRLDPLRRRTHAAFSWPANIARANKPFPLPLLPIDQVYAAPEWRLQSVRRLPRAGSDHYGLVVTLVR